MSATTAAASASKGKSDKAAGIGRWLVAGGIILLGGALSALYGVNEYAAGTKVLLNDATANAARFESIYRENTETRLKTLRFGLELLLQDDEIRTAFARNERDALAAKVTPLYNETLHGRYNIDQLNFFTPPAIVYLRADNPKVFGNDLSATRRSVVLAGERRQIMSGVETGLGGVIALRAVAPVIVDGKLIGTMGVGDGIVPFLTNAAASSGLKFALGLDQAIAERSERASDPKNDAIQGKDIFIAFSDTATSQTMRTIAIEPRSTAPALVPAGSHTVFVKTFSITNISGIPTIVVATLLDVTEAFADVRQTVAIKGVVLFLLISILGNVAVSRFRVMKEGLSRMLVGQQREIDEKTAALAAARTKLKDAEQLKRSFLSNLVTALSEPLQAVSGQLQAVGPAVEGALRGDVNRTPEGRAEIVDNLHQALWETTRAARFITDYQQLELFRQGLVKVDTPLVSMSAVINQVLSEDVASTLRLTGIEVVNNISTGLARTRADAGLLRRAIASLINEEAEAADHGVLTVDAVVDEDSWLAVSLTCSVFQSDRAPTAESVEQARQFLTRFSKSPDAVANNVAPLGVALAFAIIEFFGGRLSAAPAGGPAGYVIQLPAAR